MKKALCISVILIVILFTFTSCGGMSISNSKFKDISKYVTENIETLTPQSETQFYDYDATGLSVGGVNYGYYYSENNEILVPDFYNGDELGSSYEKDEGTYFGKPNDGKDWCFVRQITDKWFYYELHW